MKKSMSVVCRKLGLSVMSAAGLSALVLVGCSKKSDTVEAPAATPDAAPSVTTPARPVTPAVRSTLPETPAVDGQSQSILPTPFRVGAIIDRGDNSILVGLISDETGYHDMVEVGDTFEGYNVIEIDAVASEVFLERDGQRYVARLSAGSGIVSTVPPRIADPSTLSAENIGSFSAGEFTPTADEIARGIDPNNPDTWPDGYRGPGIERAGFEEVKYEQTEDEKKRGIDPNDPETWPSGYRGPGIERAMLEMQQQE